MNDEIIETATYYGVEVTQAGGRLAEKRLIDAGFSIAASGWDGSSTMWRILLMDKKDECPTSTDEAERARAELWNNGWGYVSLIEQDLEV